ncbi:hypothetical protein SARC_13779 [Sphaeroforma arctica JP610]|uniref:Uncharacterized protein n=1 Tax=Sphaeroforma arctica JP610 TaxID=667725 RepID=A0A0L0FAD3_9EUKA|nr:hypothetical protein SARC_13779 [Sphaeroforma arctica JP610]KNC73662.1 hypothetical protein SARC_13779 [Sphaeroforma arctica JP610]|eukprot:XP_014147564.1 hypothetical protein SARC_13779 [Sphaeroforma arctica JP610]
MQGFSVDRHANTFTGYLAGSSNSYVQHPAPVKRVLPVCASTEINQGFLKRANTQMACQEPDVDATPNTCVYSNGYDNMVSVSEVSSNPSYPTSSTMSGNRVFTDDAMQLDSQAAGYVSGHAKRSGWPQLETQTNTGYSALRGNTLSEKSSNSTMDQYGGLGADGEVETWF